MVTLLRDGFGFELDSSDITFTFLVDGSEVEWSLGMAISHFAEDHSHAVTVRKPEVEIESNANDLEERRDPCPSPSCTSSMLNRVPVQWQFARS